MNFVGKARFSEIVIFFLPNALIGWCPEQVSVPPRRKCCKVEQAPLPFLFFFYICLNFLLLACLSFILWLNVFYKFAYFVIRISSFFCSIYPISIRTKLTYLFNCSHCLSSSLVVLVLLDSIVTVCNNDSVGFKI